MRNPDPRTGSTSELGWWIVLLALLAFIAWMQAIAGALATADDQGPGNRVELVFQGKYLLGAHRLADRLGAAGFGTGGVDPVASFEATLVRPADRLAAAPLWAEMGDPERAMALVDGVRSALASEGDSEPADDRAETLREAELFATLLGGEEIDHEDSEALLADYGWFAELALARVDRDPAGDDRGGSRLAELRSKAERVTLIVAAGFGIGLLALLAGALLVTIGFVLHSRGRLGSGYLRGEQESNALAVEARERLEVMAPSESSEWPMVAEPMAAESATAESATAGSETSDVVAAGSAIVGSGVSPGPGSGSGSRIPYLETVVVFIVAVQVIGAVVGALMFESPGTYWPLALQWLVLPVLAWPLLRGRELGEWRHALGIGPGQSWIREVMAGLVAYVAAIPLLALGLVGSMLVSRFSDSKPHHPVVDWLGGGDPSALGMVVMLAVIWAPIVEEGIFRGAFYHYLRGRLGVLASAVVVGLIFAGLHPQGLAGLPFLLCLALALALAREWRGSVVASITMHMVHNGLAVGLMAVLFA